MRVNIGKFIHIYLFNKVSIRVIFVIIQFDVYFRIEALFIYHILHVLS